MEGPKSEINSISNLHTAISQLTDSEFNKLKQFMKKEETSRRTAKAKNKTKKSKSSC